MSSRFFTLLKSWTRLFVFIFFLFIMNHSTFMAWIYPIDYVDEIREAAHSYEVDPHLVLAVIKSESSFDQSSISRKGAHGVMQLMPRTAEWINEMSHLGQPVDAYKHQAEANIFLGTWYLAYLLNKYDGVTTLALAAYNAGEGNVDQWLSEGRWDGSEYTLKQIPFGETRHYIAKINYYYEQYRSIYGDLFTMS